MKYVDEFRDPEKARRLAAAIVRLVSRPWVLMELCGGQTHSLLRYGIDQILPAKIELVHGPGCPVCVTPVEKIDAAIQLSLEPGVIFCTFGDMLRVPGTQLDLFSAKARGADVRLVYSPLDALAIAKAHPQREVVFFAVGFETTAPANAMAAYEAKRQGIANFSFLVSHVLVPPAMTAILSAPENRVQGFLAAGHVCTVMGTSEYEPIAHKHRVPVVVTGFEPLDLLEGVYLCVRQLESGEAKVENQYVRSVKSGGNPAARDIIEKVFTVSGCRWRGIGEIERSGMRLREEYSEFDAELRFAHALRIHNTSDPIGRAVESECISGLILQGLRKPGDCPAFGVSCSPDHPLGAPMVSSEGACAAYWKYRRAQRAGVQ